MVENIFEEAGSVNPHDNADVANDFGEFEKRLEAYSKPIPEEGNPFTLEVTKVNIKENDDGVVQAGFIFTVVEASVSEYQGKALIGKELKRPYTVRVKPARAGEWPYSEAKNPERSALWHGARQYQIMKAAKDQLEMDIYGAGAIDFEKLEGLRLTLNAVFSSMPGSEEPMLKWIAHSDK